MTEAGGMQRVFLVGCPRSGTTLLQSMLGAHPDILALPESHFFVSLRSRIPGFHRLGLASRRARPKLAAYLRQLAPEETETPTVARVSSMQALADSFVNALDERARRAGKSIWIEKTPRHLHHIPFITRLVQGARFVHLLRDGADVVASLYAVTNEHPEAWSGARTIDQCIDRWIGDARVTFEYIGRPGHYALIYDRLIDDPKLELSGVCAFLGVAFDEAMLSGYADQAAQVISGYEPWKANAAAGLRGTRGKKLQEWFDNPTRHYIRERVSFVDLSRLDLECLSRR